VSVIGVIFEKYPRGIRLSSYCLMKQAERYLAPMIFEEGKVESICRVLILVKATNLYLNKCGVGKRKPVSLVVQNAAKFVTKMFKTFGLIPEGSGVEIGFPIGRGVEGTKKNSILCWMPLLTFARTSPVY